VRAGELLAMPEEDLRARTSIKWSRVPASVIAADIAELDFRVAEPILDAVRRAVRYSDFGYPDYSSGTPARLAEVFARRAERRFGWLPDAGRVETCSTIMQALSCAILAYSSPGDRIVTHAPTYRPIVEAIEALGRTCVMIPVRNLGDVSELDSASGRLATTPIRMIVLCNPHNPTGHVFDRRTLQVIGEFACREGAVVFSDEIYHDLVYENSGFASAAAVDGLRQRSLVFTAASKGFGTPGLRCAVGYFGSPGVHDIFGRLPWHLRGGASLLGVNATIAAWESCDDWLDALRDQLAANLAAAAGRLSGLPGVRFGLPRATYFLWLDVRDSAAGGNPAHFLRTRARVALQPGDSFGSDFTRFARLNFATPPGRLAAILDRLAAALAGE